MATMIKYALAWLVMPIIGIINGTIRQYGYRQALGELRAHQVSTVTGIILFGVYIWALTSWWIECRAREAMPSRAGPG